MNRLLLTLLILGLVGQSLFSQTIAIDFDSIEKKLDAMMEYNNIPSLVVGIVQDGKLVKVIEKGETKRGNGIVPDANTMFQIGSLSKTFTALVYTHMAADGLIDLDRSVGSYMVDELDDSAVKELNQVKISDLLKHTAGLPNTGESVPPTPFGTAMEGGYTKEDMLTDLNNLKLNKDRLGKWSYSNLGFSLLGHLAEKVAGKSYEALIQQYVLKPNEMTSTTSILQNVRERMVTPYMVGGSRSRETAPWEMGKSIAAGGIVSTVADLSKLLIRKMKAYKSDTETNEVSDYFLLNDLIQINTHMAYGYAFFKSKNNFDSTLLQLGHGGDLDGFASHFEFYPDHDLGLVMLTGSGGGWFNDAKTVIEGEMFGFNIPEQVELDKAIVKKYTGKYDFGKNQVMTIIRRGNKLYTYFKGQDPINLYASAENKFFYLNQNSQLRFELDQKGRLKKTIYIQNGQEFYPKKIK